jgi:hypothetical protein
MFGWYPELQRFVPVRVLLQALRNYSTVHASDIAFASSPAAGHDAGTD